MELKQFILVVILSYVCLLIVPYGIETASATVAVNVPDAFNRTLWN